MFSYTNKGVRVSLLIRMHPKRPIRTSLHMQLVDKAPPQLSQPGAVLQGPHFVTSQGVLVWLEMEIPVAKLANSRSIACMREYDLAPATVAVF